MPEIIPLETAPEAVKALVAGMGADSVVFTQGDRPVATLAPTAETTTPKKKRRELGLLKGCLTVIKEDDEHLKGFEEYM